MLFNCVTITNQKVGNAPVLLRGDIDDCIRRAGAFGYDAVELHLPDPRALDVRSTLEACKTNNIRIAGIATGSTYTVHGLSLTDDSEAIRAAAVSRVKEYADLAAALSGILIIGCVRGNIADQAQAPLILERLRDSIIELSAYARPLQVPIVIEAINRYENNYLNNAAEILKFVESCEAANLKVLLDTFHMNIEEQNLESSIRLCQDHLGYFHIADSNRLYPGEGHIDFRQIFQTLQDIRYQGFVSLECNAIPDGDTASRKSIEHVRSCMGELRN